MQNQIVALTNFGDSFFVRPNNSSPQASLIAQVLRLAFARRDDFVLRIALSVSAGKGFAKIAASA